MKNKNYPILFFILIGYILITVISIEPVVAEAKYRPAAANVPECQSACKLLDDCSVGRLSDPDLEGYHYNNPDFTDFGSCERFTTGSGEWFACMDECREELSKSVDDCRSCLKNAAPPSSETSTSTNDKDETLTDSDARIAKLEAELDRIRGETSEEEDKVDEELEPVEKIKPKLVLKTFGEPFKKLTFSKGQVEMLRGGKVEKVTKDLEFKAGDMIHTGGDGGMEIAVEDGTIKVDKDTTLEFVGLDFDPVAPRRVISPPPEAPWALDTSVRYEIDNKAFWDGFAEDITGFVAETNIDLEIIGCLKGASIIGCMSSAASVLHSGTAWFKKEIEKDLGVSVVITPKTIFFPDGTEFSVDVADDGSTTVTVFDGRVIAIDLDSREIAVVGVDEQLTTGSEVTKIDSKSIDMWWNEDISTPKTPWVSLSIFFLLVCAVVGMTAFFVKKYTKPKTKAWGITSLIFGIFSIILSITAIFGLPFAIGAIWVSRIQKKQNPTKLATAGLILGIIGTIFALLAILISVQSATI